MTSIADLKRQLENLSTYHALVVLSQGHGMANKTFIWNGQLYTIQEALKTIPAYLLELRCGDFGTLRFYGGPPQKGAWYGGTVLTMLCDAVLFDESTTNLSESQRLMA